MHSPFHRLALLSIVVVAVVLAAGCGRKTRPDAAFNPADVPSSFDVTLLAAKDDQFELNSVPITSEDLRSALRYMKDESQPLSTVLLKRGEKQKVKDTHIVSLAQMSHALGFKAYVQGKEEIAEIRTTAASD